MVREKSEASSSEGSSIVSSGVSKKSSGVSSRNSFHQVLLWNYYWFQKCFFKTEKKDWTSWQGTWSWPRLISKLGCPPELCFKIEFFFRKAELKSKFLKTFDILKSAVQTLRQLDRSQKVEFRSNQIQVHPTCRIYQIRTSMPMSKNHKWNLHFQAYPMGSVRLKI